MTFIANNMKFGRRVIRIFIYSILLPLSVRATDSNTNVHTTWLWHLHQPIYWPDRAPANHAADHYQNAWDTIQLGNAYPSDTSLTTVFGEADRVNACKSEPSGTMSGLRGYPNAGVQLNTSGALGSILSNLAGASNDPGLLQLQLNHTDAPSATTTQRFYRIQLLP